MSRSLNVEFYFQISVGHMRQKNEGSIKALCSHRAYKHFDLRDLVTLKLGKGHLIGELTTSENVVLYDPRTC